MISNKKIFIFGGSGSLGNKLIERYLKDNLIVNYSRDEAKHWKMGLKYKSDKISFIIGDIRDYNRVENSIIRENPHIIIIAAALKHIDRCEYAVNECFMTNFMGPNNVLNAVEKNAAVLSNLECVCFISTDKACNAISAYGSAKFLGERIVCEKAFYLRGFKMNICRYGNVLNSNGSIIPALHEKGLDPDCKEFTLTHEKMTRFVITLESAVDLLEHAILNAESGDIVIPTLVSMNVKDLFELFSEKYNKPIRVTGLRSSERLLETLISTTESTSIVKNGNYYHIKPHYKHLVTSDEQREYNSDINPLTKEELKDYLISLNLL